MGRHFLAAKANWDFLPNLPFLPILLNVLIVAFSLVVLKAPVGGLVAHGVIVMKRDNGQQVVSSIWHYSTVF